MEQFLFEIGIYLGFTLIAIYYLWLLIYTPRDKLCDRLMIILGDNPRYNTFNPFYFVFGFFVIPLLTLIGSVIGVLLAPFLVPIGLLGYGLWKLFDMYVNCNKGD